MMSFPIRDSGIPDYKRTSYRSQYFIMAGVGGPAGGAGALNEIINDRIVDTQLDQCDLKFDELGRVKRAFIFTLTNMLHSRIAYPKDDNRDHQSAERESGEPKETGRADTTYPVASRSS